MSRIDFGINIKNPTVVPATAEGFAKAAEATETGRICAELSDALEEYQRGQLRKEEYQEAKTSFKQHLPFYTPHAHFRGGYKAGDRDPVDSGKALLDIDNYAAGPQLYANHIKGRERELGINAAYTTASANGFAILFDIPKGLTRQQAQAWMAHELGDVDYDKGVHDLTRAAYIPCREYFCYLDEELMFGDELHPAELSEEELRRWQQMEVKSEAKAATPEPLPVEPEQAVTRTLFAFDEALRAIGLTLEQLNREGVRHNTLKLLLPTLCQMMSEQELMAVLAERMPEYSREKDCRALVHDFYEKYVDSARPMTQKQRELFLKSLKVMAATVDEETDGQTIEKPMIARKGLPPSLQACLKPYPDTFIMPHLTGIMPALMTLADGVTVRYCDGKIHHLGAMAIIMSEQSSNKGTVKDNVDLWIKDLREEDNVVRRKEDMVRAKNRVRKHSERGEEEPRDVLRLPTITISCSKLLKRLKLAQGHTLYSLCTEIDTLRKSNGAGAWSAKYDIYRVAFDHDRWGQDYNSDQSESGEVEVGYNWTILGTPGSVAKCFENDNVENGLSSRIMISSMPNNMFAKLTVFKELTETDLKRIEEGVALLRKAQGFYDTPRLRKAISQWLEEKRIEAAMEMSQIKDTYRRRAAVIGFRCGVVYMLLCGKESNACLKFATDMAEYTLQQQMKFFGPLLIKQMRRSQEKEQQLPVNTNIYKQLPSPFTLNELRKLKGSEYTDSTLYSIISRWKKEGWIEKVGKNSWNKLLEL